MLNLEELIDWGRKVLAKRFTSLHKAGITVAMHVETLSPAVTWVVDIDKLKEVLLAEQDNMSMWPRGVAEELSIICRSALVSALFGSFAFNVRRQGHYTRIDLAIEGLYEKDLNAEDIANLFPGNDGGMWQRLECGEEG